MRRRFLIALPPLAAPAVLLATLAPASRAGARLPPQPGEPAAEALLERLRRGGLVLFIRHADTGGQPCDRSFRLGEREGQRNLSPAGQGQARALGARLAALGIPLQWPVLAGPVFRARDTAELALGAERVRIEDGLVADDYAGARLGWSLEQHRRLFGTPPAPGLNRVLVGHRGPAQMILGDAVRGTRLPEAGVLVLEPRRAGAAGENGREGFRLLGILQAVPALNGGNPGCGG
ncbi:histidine phosphatase family protein [Teichococcus vastitatis]|uniref:Histidine phosphatase family protein n=1 Tax=Teichococcus vastitatis TaxID=2307076 RepID=A0ABS9W358_9PROT|nr:histidine phosphatase family protein [Pseudoroseomonas vastitatis]MCI0753708.1 histidine phosphatase family protein [Pseudoroseomonas vastitatis]